MSKEKERERDGGWDEESRGSAKIEGRRGELASEQEEEEEEEVA